MVSSTYADSVVNIMLGWLKGFAGWVLRLFNLAGGGSPLQWLSENWLKLLILFLIVGTVTDFLVWMVRWRPYWVWFRKKRVVIHDDNFFAAEKIDNMEDLDDDELFSNDWGNKKRRKKAPARKPVRSKMDDYDRFEAQTSKRSKSRKRV